MTLETGEEKGRNKEKERGACRGNDYSSHNNETFDLPKPSENLRKEGLQQRMQLLEKAPGTSWLAHVIVTWKERRGVFGSGGWRVLEEAKAVATEQLLRRLSACFRGD